MKVSIVLPCRNEVEHIEACLESVLAQQAPEGGFEIIVADGMSTDGTRERLDALARAHPQLRVLNNPGRIVSTGLNAAIRAAHGEYIIRMDAHTTYAPDYIRSCLEVMQETGADNVGGPVLTVAHTPMQKTIQAVYHSAFAVGGARSHNPNYEGPVDTVLYGCWKKEIFERVGYFDEDLVRNQDDEHNFRLTRSGGKLYQSRRIRSWYHVRGSLNALFHQYMQYGFWKVLVIRKHGSPASLRHLVPGGFLALLGLLLVAGFIWQPAWWAGLGLFALYAGVVLLVSLVTAAHAGWKLFPMLPLAFGCFHFGYGYGFLRGLLDLVILQNAPHAAFVRLTRKEPARRQPASLR